MTDINQHLQEQKIPTLSFFTGGGFLNIGFERSGFNVIWSNEIEPDFIMLYNHAYSAWLEHEGFDKEGLISSTESIETLTVKSILKNAWDKQPEIFGIIGGSPCQDFSASGHNFGFRGKRGRLTKIYIQAVKQIQPTFFVLENVQNLIRKHKNGLNQAIQCLREDYCIDWAVLNSINFGVPQDRNRLFIVGFKRSIFDKRPMNGVPFYFPWPFNEKYNNSLTNYTWPTRNKFGKSIRKPTGIPKELTVGYCLLNTNSRIANSNEYFKSYSSKFWTVEEGNTRERSFKRLHRHRYSPTACYGNNEVHLHPFEPRRISVREALRIQSVPDSYELPQMIRKHVGLASKFKMIGNAVPAALSAAVAQSINSFLKERTYLYNGHLDKRETEQSDVKNPVKEHKTGEVDALAPA